MLIFIRQHFQQRSLQPKQDPCIGNDSTQTNLTCVKYASNFHGGPLCSLIGPILLKKLIKSIWNVIYVTIVTCISITLTQNQRGYRKRV